MDKVIVEIKDGGVRSVAIKGHVLVEIRDYDVDGGELNVCRDANAEPYTYHTYAPETECDAPSAQVVNPVVISIPVLIARNGEMIAGSWHRDSEGTVVSEHDFAVDTLSEEAYKAGYVVVVVNASLDIEQFLRRYQLAGQVEEQK